MNLISYRGNISGPDQSRENFEDAMEDVVFYHNKIVAVDVVLTNPRFDHKTGKFDGTLRLGHNIHSYDMSNVLNNYFLMTHTFLMCHDILTASYLMEEFTLATGKYYDCYHDIVLLGHNQQTLTARKNILVNSEWQGDMSRTIFFSPYKGPHLMVTTDHCSIITSYIKG